MSGVIIAKTIGAGALYGVLCGLLLGNYILGNDPKKSALVGFTFTTASVAAGHLVGPIGFYSSVAFLFTATLAYNLNCFQNTCIQTLFLRHFGL